MRSRRIYVKWYMASVVAIRKVLGINLSPTSFELAVLGLGALQFVCGRGTIWLVILIRRPVTRWDGGDGPGNPLFGTIKKLRKPIRAKELQKCANELSTVVFPLVNELSRLVGNSVHQLFSLLFHLFYSVLDFVLVLINERHIEILRGITTSQVSSGINIVILNYSGNQVRG